MYLIKAVPAVIIPVIPAPLGVIGAPGVCDVSVRGFTQENCAKGRRGQTTYTNSHLASTHRAFKICQHLLLKVHLHTELTAVAIVGSAFHLLQNVKTTSVSLHHCCSSFYSPGASMVHNSMNN